MLKTPLINVTKGCLTCSFIHLDIFGIQNVLIEDKGYWIIMSEPQIPVEFKWSSKMYQIVT